MSADRTTEILNYLSAMSRDMGEMRAQLGGLQTEVRELRAEMNTRFNSLERKIDILNRDMLQLKADQVGLEQRVEVLENK